MSEVIAFSYVAQITARNYILRSVPLAGKFLIEAATTYTDK